MNKEITNSRRRFLTISGISTMSLLSGCIDTIEDKTSNLPYNINKSASSILFNNDDINISLFQTKELYDLNKENKTALHSLKLCKNYLNEELSKLDSDISININVINTPVNFEKDDVTRDAFYHWENYFVNNISSKYKSRDANLLLTDMSDSDLISGMAEMSCLCNFRSSISIIYNAGSLVEHDSTKVNKKIFGDKLRPLSTALHEIGHNIGFKHSMGYGWYEEDENIIKTTPMLSVYVLNEYNNKVNYFGDKIVNARKYIHMAPIKHVSYLNPKLTHQNVKYELFND